MIRGIGVIAAFIVASVAIVVDETVVISWHENLVEDAKIKEGNAKNREEAKIREEKRTFYLLSTSHIKISTPNFYIVLVW